MHKQRERETFGFSQPGDRGLAFDVCGRWQPLMRISMATERLWLQIELAEPHLLRSTGREHQGPENTDGSCGFIFIANGYVTLIPVLLSDMATMMVFLKNHAEYCQRTRGSKSGVEVLSGLIFHFLSNFSFCNFLSTSLICLRVWFRFFLNRLKNVDCGFKT